jgi:hypothetical protein
MFGAMGISGIAAAKTHTGITGVICLGILGGFCWFLFILVKRPTVRIVGESIEVRGLLGGMHHIKNVREYSLVLANDWIGFRRAGHGDIMLEQRRFPRKVWSELGNELRQLPFAGVV